MFLTILILTTSTLSSAANNLVVFQVHRSPSIESTITSTPSLLVSHENNYFQRIKTSWGNTSVDLPDLDRTLNYTITSTEDSEWLCPPIPLIVHTFNLANKLFCSAKKLPENNGFVTSFLLISMTLCVVVLCTYNRTNICMIKNKESNKKLVRRRRRRPRSLTPERSRHVQESSDEEVEEEEENADFNFEHEELYDDNGLNLPPSEVLHSTPHEFSSWINNNIYQTND